VNSCSFIYVSEGEDGFPRLQVIHGSDATGVLDPVTRLLTEAYAVLSRDDYGKPVEELYFTEEYTEYFVDGKLEARFPNPAPYPLLVPIIQRRDSTRPFGRYRFTKATLYYQHFARLTLERADVTAELYTWTQKSVVGLSQETEPME